MKYSAAFAASVASKPDLNAYSGIGFFGKGATWKQISNSYLTSQGKGPVLGRLQVWRGRGGEGIYACSRGS